MLLSTMRKGFLSAIFLGLLVLGAVGLIFSDWTGSYRGVGSTDVAKVDGTPIKMSEFNNNVKRILQTQKIDPSTAYQMGLINNILNGQITDLLIQKDATKLGIKIEDSMIAEQVKAIIEPYKQEGMSDKDALKLFLEQNAMSEKKLVGILRDDLTSNILKSTIASAAYAPEILINALTSYQNISRNVDFVFIPNSSVILKKTPNDKELEEYYQAQTSQFMLPETRDITIALLDSVQIKTPKVSDESILEAYNGNKEKYNIPETAEVEQSLFQDKETAESVAKLAKSGQSLEEAVKKITGDKKAFLGKNSFAENGLPSEIATSVFESQAGDIVGPIKSALGYHVIKLIAVKPSEIAPFDTVKEKIRKEVQDEKSGNAIFDVTSDIEDRLANGETFEIVKKDYPLSLITLKNITKSSQNDKNNQLDKDQFDKVIAKAFSLKDNIPSELNDLSATKMFSIRADKIYPSTPKPFLSVKGDILKKWIIENQMKENLITSQKTVDDLTNQKIKFTDLKPTSVKALTKSGDAIIAKDIVRRLMLAEPAKFIMAISTEKNGIYIARVNSVTLPTQATKIDKDLYKDIESSISNSNYMNYVGYLQDKYSVKINEKLLGRIYDKSPTENE